MFLCGEAPRLCGAEEGGERSEGLAMGEAEAEAEAEAAEAEREGVSCDAAGVTVANENSERKSW